MKWRVLSVILMITLIAVIALITLSSMVPGSGTTVVAASGDLIDRVYTDEARYDPGDVATVTVEIDNQTGSSWNGTLYLNIDHLETAVYTATQSLNVSSGVTTTRTLTWTVPSADFQGYHVEVKAGTTDQNATAIDVSSDWTRYPRYGYVHDFSSSQTQAQSEAKLDELSENYHINAVQFYDWMWRHENVISRTNGTINDPWYDWAGNPISYGTIRDLITATHDVNAAAMPYFMLYGGLQGYEQVSNVNPQWGLFSDTGHANQIYFDFGDDDSNTNLWIFNPNNTNWQNHIFRQFDEAIQTVDFDGIHLDQMGNYWGTTYYDYWGNTVDLGNSFSAELNNAKEHVNALTPNDSSDAALTFNIVNGGVGAWGVNDVVDDANLDFYYSEIWENSTTYKQIYDFVRDVREKTGKPIVLAAYVNYDQPVVTRYEAEDATLYNVGTNTNHTGYTGSGFVDQYGESGDYVQFSITVPEAGDYALAFRYANDTGSTCTRSVYVDGVDKTQLQFPDLANWDTWGVARYVVNLSGGSHTIKLARDAGDSGYINLDNLYTYREDTSLKYEAESATLNNVGTNTDHIDFTGTGFVDGFGESGDYVQFSINVPEDGKYALVFRYANDSGNTNTRSVYVDGVDKAQIEFQDQENWDTWAADAYYVADLTSGNHTIKLARDAADSGYINLDNLALGTFDENSVRLADAAFAASGAFHIEMGEGDQMLGHPYFPNSARQMRSSLQAAMRDHYDFITAYENLLFDPDLIYGDSGLQWISISGETVSGDAITNTIWVLSKRNADYDVIHLINLTNNNDNLWRNVASTPITKTNLSVKFYVGPDVSVSGVYVASPDIDHGVSKSLDYSTGSDSNGNYVSFTVPTLKYWNVIYVKRSFTAPSGDRYEAESAIDSVSYQSGEKALFFHDPGDAGSGRTRTIDFGLVLTTTTGATDGYKVYQITDAGYLSKAFTLSGSGSRTIDALIVGATTPSTGQNLYDSTIKQAINWFVSANVGALRSTTESYWTDLLDDITTFESPDATYNAVFKRSILTAYLYFDAEMGGMGAGSYNGAYFYNWPRDAVYGAVTLDKVGLHDVAEDVYDWLWNVAKRDTSGNDYGSDGKYYRFWYQKYTMDGEPEWWNPQIDETAVIPWGAWYHYQQTGDSQFLTDYDDLVKEAGLVSSEDNDHPGLDYNETRKLMFSMNAWEDKWGMFLYTNANVYAGLRDGASFMTAAGDNTTAITFTTRASNIYTGVTGLYSSTVGYYAHALDVKKNYTDQAIVDTDVSADISMLGLVTPFNVEPVTKTEVISTLLEVEEALTDFSETKMAYGGVVRYRADQEERYGSDYRDLGDSYYDGGPWMMPTDWMSEYYLEWADTMTGTAKIDEAKDYLDYVIGYLGNLGLGAEQIDENKPDTEFALETAWANVWESNGKIIDNMMAFIDYQYDAPNDSITVSPKLPSDWNHLGSHIQIKDGDLYIKVTKGANQRLVDLDNNSSNNLSVNIYVQTDAQPTSVTGTSLNWSYDSTTGRVRLYGTLNASTSEDITINF